MDAGTFIYCRGWSEAKPGKDADENQDAFQTRLIRDAAGDSTLVAVCDGASATVFAGRWARALAGAAQPDWAELDDDLLTARLDSVRERFRQDLPADLKWYMTAKLDKEGSQSTLMAASFTRTPGSSDIRCRAVAVGDSPLIIFRRDGSTAAFPLTRSADFGLSPKLISTKPQPGLEYERWDATLGPGDVLVGCTDAVGKWALEGDESADRSSFFGLLLALLDDDGDGEPGAGPDGATLFGRIAGASERPLEQDDVTIVVCVPVPPRDAAAPLDGARQVLREHLAGDFEPGPVPAPAGIAAIWRRVLDWIRRVARAALRLARRWISAVRRWVVRVWPGRRRPRPPGR